MATPLFGDPIQPKQMIKDHYYLFHEHVRNEKYVGKYISHIIRHHEEDIIIRYTPGINVGAELNKNYTFHVTTQTPPWFKGHITYIGSTGVINFQHATEHKELSSSINNVPEFLPYYTGNETLTFAIANLKNNEINDMMEAADLATEYNGGKRVKRSKKRVNRKRKSKKRSCN